MSSDRAPFELTLERTVVDASGRPVTVRVSRRIEVVGSDVPGKAGAEEIASLRAELDKAVGVVAPGEGVRPDRSLDELVQTYRPRQPELLDLLREEGELTGGEFDRLRQHLAVPPPLAPAAGVPLAERPIAAAPLENDRTPIVPRPVDELIRTFQIASLKQAGAVRARRQISFEEYMALKRHFAPPAVA
ncbi:MAG: hypothetical protein L3K17_00960 [Thermoplasmata archaeon]|nr:hypothetical protein [Thermoplasmata archaeon]